MKRQTLDLEMKNQAALIRKLDKQEGTKGEDLPLFTSEAKKIADELKYLHWELFESSQKSRKEDIRQKIETLEWKLIETTL